MPAGVWPSSADRGRSSSGGSRTLAIRIPAQGRLGSAGESGQARVPDHRDESRDLAGWDGRGDKGSPQVMGTSWIAQFARFDPDFFVPDPPNRIDYATIQFNTLIQWNRGFN